MILSSKKILLSLLFIFALSFQRVHAASFELHMAVRSNDIEGLRTMLKLKQVRKNINVQEQATGWTPLHLSVIFGHLSCAKILLRAGAGPAVQDFYGRTPLAYALTMENTQHAGLFIYRLFEARWNRPKNA